MGEPMMDKHPILVEVETLQAMQLFTECLENYLVGSSIVWRFYEVHLFVNFWTQRFAFLLVMLKNNSRVGCRVLDGNLYLELEFCQINRSNSAIGLFLPLALLHAYTVDAWEHLSSSCRHLVQKQLVIYSIKAATLGCFGDICGRKKH